MDFSYLISRFLGVKDLSIENVIFYDSELRIKIIARQNCEHRLCCKCEYPLSGTHDWQVRQVVGAPLGIFTNVEIEFHYPRGECQQCGKVRTPRIDWINKRCRSLSCGFSEVAGRWLEETTCEATSRILKRNSKSLWRLDQWRMRQMLFELKLPDNIDCSYLTADEVHSRSIKITNRPQIWSKKLHQEYVTNLVSYKDGKVLWNSIGREKASLDECFKKLTPEQRNSCEFFCSDIHRPFIQSARQNLPNAKLAVDRFHVVQKLTDAMDSLRKSEFKKVKEDKDMKKMLHPHRRYIFTAKPSERTEAEKNWLDNLRNLNKNINTGLLLVEYFYCAIDAESIEVFRKNLINWYKLVRQSRLSAFTRVSKTIRRCRKFIEVYIASGLTTAVSEGLNNKIKTLKRVGYGYPNTKSFQLKILQRCGYLNHYHINTDKLFYSWY